MIERAVNQLAEDLLVCAGVAADEHDAIGVGDIAQGGHRAEVKRRHIALQQGDFALSKTSWKKHSKAASDSVCQARRNEPADHPRVAKFCRHTSQSVIPAGLHQFAVTLDERLLDARRFRPDDFKAARRAQQSAIRRIPIAFDAQQVVVAGEGLDAAAHRATDAGCGGAGHLGLVAEIGAVAVVQRAGRTDLQTSAT